MLPLFESSKRKKESKLVKIWVFQSSLSSFSQQFNHVFHMLNFEYSYIRILYAHVFAEEILGKRS